MSKKKTPKLRALMPALQNKKYFNYGGQGPLPQPSLEAITTSWIKIQELGPFTNKVWPFIASEQQATRQCLAKICGITSSRIALTENVTSGCILPLWGLPFFTGDRLLISDCEHPGVVSACRELADRKLLEIDILQVKQLRQGDTKQNDTEQSLLENLEKALKPKTRLVVLSHILWNTGQRMSISAVSKRLSTHPNKPFLLVDAAQSFGQIPVREAASKADIYAFTGHKWACGPEGLGAVAISERVLEESKPTLIGWRSLQHEGSCQLDNPIPFHIDSRRFEIATSCVPLLAGLRCSLRLLEEEGSELRRLKKILESSSKLWNVLNKLEGVHPILTGPPPSGLVSFQIPSKPSTREIVKLLGREGVWIRDLEDPICLRACLHITSNDDEIKTLMKAIQKLVCIN
ncbi:aminotransferase class V-fold PLP-dependent enzyme [Prochlorococcus sp. MIT 1307]|uniref:aminotransferase class V-fold PLP-dependent enzyme n=1 Tax=Prochlorococcus sp. MIT 1307 TaxID=3096219 RepID=UPI002A75A636|nr:aminotransferase class V-fold PLP-dependent enzyme [Prochlorococcus sp. MIT 1307]